MYRMAAGGGGGDDGSYNVGFFVLIRLVILFVCCANTTQPVYHYVYSMYLYMLFMFTLSSRRRCLLAFMATRHFVVVICQQMKPASQAICVCMFVRECCVNVYVYERSVGRLLCCCRYPDTPSLCMHAYT